MNEESDDKGGIDTAAVIASASQDVATIPANVTTVVMSEENASTDNVITTTSAENVDTVTQDSVQGNVTTVVMTEGANTVVATSSDTVPDTIAAPTGGPPRVAAGHIVNAVNLMSHMSQADVSDESTDEDDSGAEEPATKRLKLEQDINIDMDQSVKQILFNINKAICLRLDSIENKLESVGMRTKYLEEKVVELCAQRNNSVFNPYATKRGSTSQSQRSSAVIVGLPQEKNNGEAVNSGGFNTQMDNNFRNLGSNVTLITLNSEEDYPNGCWLGDENNPEMRVRVPISSSDLLHIHSNCRTPEKMALTLLDYLFDRETQACSNLSGMGKHGKKQLDPLMIYGIWCHLIYRFGVGESDWQRIKQNIDSKCRTAFRRKLRGLPLTVKAFRGKAPPSYVYNPVMGLYNSIMNSQSSFEDYSNHEDNKFHIQQGDVDIQHAVTMQGEAIQQGEIQILHATPEQISQLQQAQHIQILQGDHVIQQLQSGDGPDGVQVAVSMGTPDGVHVATVTTDNGEVLHIHQAQAAAAANQTVTTAPGTSTATTAAAAATSVTSAAPSSEQQE